MLLQCAIAPAAAALSPHLHANVAKACILRRGSISLCTPPEDDIRDAKQLRERLKRLAQQDQEDMVELQSRMRALDMSDQEERELYVAGRGALPVVCLDAMVPRQRMAVETDDPTFCSLLQDLSLGGLFVMTSLNPARRMLRRSGVVVRVTLVDAKQGMDRVPTAVRAEIVGRRRVRLFGPQEGMRLRVGRFRRGYGDGIMGSDSALGWGEERFVDRSDAAISSYMRPPPDGGAGEDVTDWSATPFVVLGDEDEALLYGSGGPCDVFSPVTTSDVSDAKDAEEAAAALDLAERVAAALDQWISLAQDPRTYDNVDVVAGTRSQHGQPGLRVDPGALLEGVLEDLGPRPPPSAKTALAFWGAALINPLPALGVAPECRGAILEARSPADRLKILLRAVERSIRNLEGTTPL